MNRLTDRQLKMAIDKAVWIDASPHEWPTQDDIPLSCNALLDVRTEVARLRERLEKAELERDDRTVMAARTQEAMRYLMNGLPADDAVCAAYGNADSARAWLAARDVRMKALGAVGVWEIVATQASIRGDASVAAYADKEAAQKRREAGR